MAHNTELDRLEARLPSRQDLDRLRADMDAEAANWPGGAKDYARATTTAKVLYYSALYVRNRYARLLEEQDGDPLG